MTIRKLAEELNLSVGTISKALKDSYEISTETKRRVHEMAVRLNYIPNPYASSLRKRKSKTIGVVVPEISDSFFSLAINGIESVARTKGYHVLIYLTHEDVLREEAILNDFKSGRVDGVLLSVTKDTREYLHINALQENAMPVVLFDRVCSEVDTAKVMTNDFEMGYVAASHLAERGCTKIAYLATSPNLAITNERMAGYKKALEDYCIAAGGHAILCPGSDTANLQAIEELLDHPSRPDGVIASVEKLAMPVYNACSRLGLTIPADIKLVGFCNLETAAFLNPSLTTITQPAYEMGERAAQLLFRSLEKNSFMLAEQNVVITSQLNIRASTGGA
ncbi:LacI family DNA-binding transcriptional regulator [Foetidibacter luteolus]|uniref:LacI family DNA-binding transcriptional regulator n=1 Tax=Foetidibacter luteolus TaxID=2608880 RepID=UPI001F3D6A2A|nr:LacI family DNA-binding transcriptional regulator [Foetidibacter luteolus]